MSSSLSSCGLFATMSILSLLIYPCHLEKEEFRGFKVSCAFYLYLLFVVSADWYLRLLLLQISSWIILSLTTSAETTSWWGCCWGRWVGLFRSPERSVRSPSRCWRGWWSNIRLMTAMLPKWVLWLPLFFKSNNQAFTSTCDVHCRANRPDLPPSTFHFLACCRKMSADFAIRNLWCQATM